MQPQQDRPFRVIAREVVHDEFGAPRVVSQAGRFISRDTSIDIGREGNLGLGLELPDRGVSRVAVTVVPTESHWSVAVGNRSGIVLCPWGLPRTFRGAGSVEHIPWPRVAIRVLATEPRHFYWVLLETDMYPLPKRGFTADGQRSRYTPHKVPEPLSDNMTAAVRKVFAEYLMWPPLPAPRSMVLARAASGLGISSTGLGERLTDAQGRANALGLHGRFPNHQVDWVHHLVAWGYVRDVPEFVTDVTEY